MRQRRTTSTASALTIAALLVLGLTGCGEVNAGSAAAREFEQVMADVPEVVDVSTSSSNTLPWAGTASASVLLDDAVSDDRLSEIVDRIGGFLNERANRSGGASWEGVEIAVRDFTVSVLDRRTDNEVQLALLARLEEAGVPGGALLLGPSGPKASPDTPREASLTLVAGGGEDFLAAYDLARLVSEQTPAYTEAAVTGRSGAEPDGVTDDAAAFPAWDEGARFSITSRGEDEASAGDPGPSRAAYVAVAEQFDVIAATITPTALDLRVANAADVAGATELAESVAAGNVTVAVQGGIVTWGEDGPATAMQPVVEALSTVPDVVSIDATSTHLGLVVGDPTAGRAALDVLDALPEASVVETLRISGPVAVDAPDTFAVAGARDASSALFDLVERLTEADLVTSFDGATDRVLVEVRGSDDASLSAAIALVKEAVDPGTSTQIRVAGSPGYWWFDAADTIDLEAPSSGDETAEEIALRDRIERLWNAA